MWSNPWAVICRVLVTAQPATNSALAITARADLLFANIVTQPW